MTSLIARTRNRRRPVPRVRGLSVLALASVAALCQAAAALTLDETSMGRFGAGHRVTAQTADQNLLAWNVRSTGRQLELSLYGPDARLVSLGTLGLPAPEGQEVRNTIRSISWTGLVNRYETGDTYLDIHESLLTPALWCQTDARRLELFRAPGPARVHLLVVPTTGGALVADGRQQVSLDGRLGPRLAKPWFLAVVGTDEHPFPVLCMVNHAPALISPREPGGIVVEWDERAGANSIGLLPLLGCRPDPSASVGGWEQGIPPAVTRRADALAGYFLHLPTALTESCEISGDAVTITDTFTFAEIVDDWGWHRKRKGYALVPPALANARRRGYPVVYRRAVTDLEYPTFLGPLCLVPDSDRLTYSLPRPRLHETLLSPIYDPALREVLPDETVRTVRDYSAYVVETYARRRHHVFPHSAIGDARAMASEYPSSLMMSPEASQAFGAWADWAARERLYNRDLCYGYGREAANGRRFLIDNYRFGKDFVDAGWFGYDAVAMWARAHYGGKWSEVRENWSWIRDLFYGWTWTYSDYATMYDPLGFDADTGTGKVYGDNMATLAAHYAYARMADHIGDTATLHDALYLLARDIVGRYNRMTLYDYSRSIGYRTDVTYLVSDMWDGPNVAPSGQHIPPDSSRWLGGAVTDYGDYAAGLWYLTGSFLEPVTPATIALMQVGGMKTRVASSQALLDARYPRWYASPDAGEVANYQIYLRGALFHESPAKLRYYFDYQDTFRRGTWLAEAWHANAFAGVVLSSCYGLDHQDDCRVLVRDGARWAPANEWVEFNVIVGAEGQQVLVLINRAGGPLHAEVRLDPTRLGAPTGAGLRNLKRDEPVVRCREGAYRMTLAPGVNLYALTAGPGRGRPLPPKSPPDLEVQHPDSITVVTRSAARFPVTLVNHGRAAERARVRSEALSIAGTAAQDIALEPRERLTLECRYEAQSECRAPFDIEFCVEWRGRKDAHQIEVLALPVMVALVDLDVPSVVRGPVVGSAHVMVRSRSDREESLLFQCRLGPAVIEERDLAVDPGARLDEDMRLEANLPSDVYTLSASASGPHLEPAERSQEVVFFAPASARGPDRVVIHSFEEDAQGWRMPDWPDGNKDPGGVTYQVARSDTTASQGRWSLEVPVNLRSGARSQAFVGVSPAADWTLLRKVAVDVYLPATAPTGLDAALYLMGDEWRWMVMAGDTALAPGEWVTVEGYLSGPEGARDWGVAEEDLLAALKHVIDIGVRIANGEAEHPGYLGPLYLDSFRVEGG